MKRVLTQWPHEQEWCGHFGVIRAWTGCTPCTCQGCIWAFRLILGVQADLIRHVVRLLMKMMLLNWLCWLTWRIVVENVTRLMLVISVKLGVVVMGYLTFLQMVGEGFAVLLLLTYMLPLVTKIFVLSLKKVNNSKKLFRPHLQIFYPT